MNYLLLLGGLLASCSALRGPSTEQLAAARQAVIQQTVARPAGIYDGAAISYRGTPLVFVDGHKYHAAKLKGLAPTSIDSSCILPPAVSTALYGRRGRYGVILFTTKKKPQE
jgi:hypothetical protein